MKKKVVIMRGLPGSGKSRYVRKNFPEAKVCSADYYFIDQNENYNFDVDNIGLAHKYSRKLFITALKNSLSLIVVDNTNIEVWEFKLYIQLAKKYDYKVSIIRIEEDPLIVIKRNIHNVSLEKILDMYESTQDYPGEILLSAQELFKR